MPTASPISASPSTTSTGVVEAIEARGIPLLIEKKTAVDCNRQAWIEDPDGNRVELMEMNPASMQLEAIRRLHREGR